MVTNVKAAIWQSLARLYFASGLHQIRHRGRVAILTYHRIVSDEMVGDEHIQAGMYVRERSFEAHVDYLRKGFVVLALEDLLELWRAERLDSRRSYCVITFDDGWQDNYRYAFPVLKKYGLPATIFLATDYIGTSRWFWPDQVVFLLEETKKFMPVETHSEAVRRTVTETPAIEEPVKRQFCFQFRSGQPVDSDAVIEWCKKLSPEVTAQFVDRLGALASLSVPERRVLLNWDEVREMNGQGISFGSHSCSHRILTQLPPSEVEKELSASHHAMLMRGINPVRVFCYPNGNCNQEVKTLVKTNGYLGAVGCDRGLEGKKPSDIFNLKRFNMHEGSTRTIPLYSLAMSGLR